MAIVVPGLALGNGYVIKEWSTIHSNNCMSEVWKKQQTFLLRGNTSSMHICQTGSGLVSV